MDPKPGWQTTEFWLTAFSSILTLVAIIWGVTPGDKENLYRYGQDIIMAFGVIVSNTLLVIEYIRNRSQVKVSQLRFPTMAGKSPCETECHKSSN